MTSIGDTLRTERIRRGWTLQQVAAEIKIRPRMIEAIEEDAFSRLPCPMMARSFVRQYAQMMCVDEKEAVEQVNQRLAESGIPPFLPDFADRSSPIPLLPPFADIRKQIRREHSLAALLWLALACFACATVYSTWRQNLEKAGSVAAESYAARSRPSEASVAPHSATPDNPKAASAALRSATSEKSETAGAEPHPATPDNPKAAAAAFRPATSENSETAAAEPHPATTGSSETGAAYRAISSPIRALFTATEPVWISVKSDGTLIYTGTLQAQQNRQFEGARKMMVTVGNAGGVIVTLNDKPIGPIGLTGEVKLLELAPEGALIHKASGN